MNRPLISRPILLVAAFCISLFACSSCRRDETVHAPRFGLDVPSPLSREQLYDELLLAAREPNIPKVVELLRQGADPNAELGRPLVLRLLSDSSGFYDAVPMLIEHGAQVNAQNEYGRTPLMYAVMYTDAEIVTLLLKHGAKVNVRNKRGHTALHLARKSGALFARDKLAERRRILEVLGSYGAVE